MHSSIAHCKAQGPAYDLVVVQVSGRELQGAAFQEMAQAKRRDVENKIRLGAEMAQRKKEETQLQRQKLRGEYIQNDKQMYVKAGQPIPPIEDLMAEAKLIIPSPAVPTSVPLQSVRPDVQLPTSGGTGGGSHVAVSPIALGSSSPAAPRKSRGSPLKLPCPSTGSSPLNMMSPSQPPQAVGAQPTGNVENGIEQQVRGFPISMHVTACTREPCSATPRFTMARGSYYSLLSWLQAPPAGLMAYVSQPFQGSDRGAASVVLPEKREAAPEQTEGAPSTTRATQPNDPPPAQELRALAAPTAAQPLSVAPPGGVGGCTTSVAKNGAAAGGQPVEPVPTPPPPPAVPPLQPFVKAPGSQPNPGAAIVDTAGRLDHPLPPLPPAALQIPRDWMLNPSLNPKAAELAHYPSVVAALGKWDPGQVQQFLALHDRYKCQFIQSQIETDLAFAGVATGSGNT